MLLANLEVVLAIERIEIGKSGFVWENEETLWQIRHNIGKLGTILANKGQHWRMRNNFGK